MSIYKCFFFFLMACMAVNGQVDISVKRIVINAGDDYTFRCRFPNYLENVKWYRRSYKDQQYSNFISHLQPTKDVPISYNPNYVGPPVACQHNVSSSPGYDIFSLSLVSMTITDSAIYSCMSENFTQRYDIKVVRCPCIMTTEPLLDHGTASNGNYVTCTLETYPVPNFAAAQTIVRRSNKHIVASILGNKIIFSFKNIFRRNQMITVSPFEHFKGNISCVVPAQPTPAPTTRMTTPVMSTTIATPTEKPPSFEGTTTTPLKSSGITTPTENPNSEPSTNHLLTCGDNSTSSQDSVPFSLSSHDGNLSQNIPKKTNGHKSTFGGAIVLVMSAVGSSVVLVLVIAMVVLRFRRKQEQAPRGLMSGRHETGEEQVPVEETDMCYASIQDNAPPGHAGEIEDIQKGGEGRNFPSDRMVNNPLYDFNSNDSRARPTTDPSTTIDVGEPLYAMPEKASKNDCTSHRDLRGNQEEVWAPITLIKES